MEELPPATPSTTTDDTEPERGVRNLIGAGPTHVSISAALRARDAARPTPDDIAAAERNLQIVRRHWNPHEEPAAAPPSYLLHR